MASSIITLTTDFGTGSPYVAAMKGVILSIHPGATVVDLTHSIPPQDVRQGALALAQVTRFFPGGTIHVAVIDPGVGTDRLIVYARIGNQQYIVPDNGLLTGLARAEAPSTMFTIANRQYWLPEVSATFHGRDIMAPVAARLSQGLPPESLGPLQTELVTLPWPEANALTKRIEGEVVAIDSFGNLVTNITADMLEGVPTDESVSVRCDEHETQGIFKTYGEQPEMTLIALVGSSGQLELAIVNDSASAMLGVRAGEKVTIDW
ncbi:MAG: SAM-dependent chlorinase/fluorinase [Pirellulales bacterium]